MTGVGCFRTHGGNEEMRGVFETTAVANLKGGEMEVFNEMNQLKRTIIRDWQRSLDPNV